MAQREKEGTLKFTTSFTPSVSISRGKRPIIAKTITTEDIPTSEVIEDFEEKNDKAKTIYRYQQKDEPEPTPTPSVSVSGGKKPMVANTIRW